MSYNNNPYQNNSYNQGPANEAGYNYAQPQENYEMQQYGQAAPAQTLSQQDFLSRVAHARNEIRSLTADIQEIAALHQRSLTSSDGFGAQQLENVVSQTQLKTSSIRSQIQFLKQDTERTTDGSRNLKQNQFKSLNKDFKDEVGRYLQEEQAYRERYREQIARQYRIVNPDASEDEVRQATDADWGNEGIFQQALRSNRSGQASAVLGNVRARHNELQRIEQSITELVGLFQDLDTVVVQQEAVTQQIEERTEQTNTNMAKGTDEVDRGIKHALRTRRNKWICAGIVFLIILAIALGVGLGVYFTNRTKETVKQNTAEMVRR